MSDLLSVLEGRVRSLTEDFKISQWAILYHTYVGVSFFFPRRGGRVEVPHHHHPDFFKRVLSVGREMTGNSETFCLEDGNLRNLIFGSSLSSSTEKPILLLPILGDNGTVLASLISGDRNPLPAHVNDSLRETERKVLRKSARLFGTFLEMHNSQLALEADLRWGKEKRSDFTDWLEWVKKEVKSCEYFLYWVREVSGKPEPLILIGSREVDSKSDKINRFLKNWDFKPGVMTCARGEPPVARNSNTKIKPLLKQEEFSLIFTFPFSSGVAGKVFHHDPGKTNYLVIEFIRRSSQKNFDDSDYFYALKAYDDLKGSMEKTISSLGGLDKRSSRGPRADYLMDVYQKNQLQIAAVRHPLSSENKAIIKTDLKPGLNVGNLSSAFKYFRIKEVSSETRSILTAGISYFLSHSLDMMDYEKKLKGFLQESLSENPLDRYLFVDLDSPTVPSPAEPDKRSSVGIVSGGFHLFHYSFENGSMKRIPDRGYRVIVHPGEDDILLALPSTLIKGDRLKQIENEMVVFGQTFPEKLVASLWTLLGETDFLLLKNSRLA